MVRTLALLLALAASACLVGCASDEDVNPNIPSGNAPAGTATNTAPTGGPNDINNIVAGATFVEKPTAFYGSFDSPAGDKPLTVKRSDNIYTSGWATLPDATDQPKMVIITFGDNKPITNADLKSGLDRPDVAKLMNKPAYAKSGWTISFPAQALPEGDTVIKAWVYDAAKKQFFRLPDYKGEKHVKVAG
jgi:hypothetical protein